MGKLLFHFLPVIMLLLGSCGDDAPKQRTLTGLWLFELNVDGHLIPFHVNVDEDTVLTVLSVRNGSERIRAERLEVVGDSVFIQLPVFNTLIKAQLTSDSTLIGTYIDRSRQGDYRIPLTGRKGIEHRFPIGQDAKGSVSGRWAVGFSPGTDDAYPAIGEFRQDGNYLEGTFLTSTGDFRFLEGVVTGDSMFLSGFDGSHAMLFKARVVGDSIFGGFWSGKHWQEPWTAVRNEHARLPDPESLTFMNPGQNRLEFSFKDVDGQMVSMSDRRFRGKVVVVQLMGSWCPNCMDETAYLVDLHKRQSSEGLEVIALAFERGSDNEVIVNSLKRMRDHFSIPYPILLAGSADKKEAAQKLPMLNHVISFPTTIFVDRKGKVRRIHTGFSGPGTGEHHTELVQRTETLVGELLNERAVF